MVRSPNRVLTPLKRAPKTRISSFATLSKIFVWDAYNYAQHSEHVGAQDGTSDESAHQPAETGSRCFRIMMIVYCFICNNIAGIGLQNTTRMRDAS